MKKIAKKNQIVIATLAVMIAAAGYMNYSGKLFPGKTKTQETNSELANKELLDISDEDTSVSSGDIKSQDGDTGSTDGNASSTDDGSVDGTPGEAVLANGTVSSVAAQAKVSREQVRSKNKETLQSIIDNKNLSDAEKENAVNQMVQMTEIAEKEAAAELPMERILLETDCPYLAPEPYRGKRNSSLYLPQVVAALAEIKGLTCQEIEDITWHNGCRFYGLE